MSTTKQDLLNFKEENQKLKENFKKFLKNHESNKKYIAKDRVKKFFEEQETLIDNLDQKIDKIIVKDEKRYSKPAQKRKIFEKSPTQNEMQALKRPRMEPDIMKNTLENFINNPGLQHLAENIFSHLNYKDLDACQLVNRSCRSILGNPKFWLRKFIQQGMSKKNQNDWINAIQLAKETDFERNLQLYLKRSLWKAKLIDIPCYIDENILQKSSEFIKEFGYQALNRLHRTKNNHSLKKFENYTAGCIQALAGIELVRDPLDFYESLRRTRLKEWARLNHNAAKLGNFEIIKIVSPLLDNPNHSWGERTRDDDTDDSDDDDEVMFTPIYSASTNGHLDIVKFLVPLSEKLSAQALEITVKDAWYYPHVVKYLRSIMKAN